MSASFVVYVDESGDEGFSTKSEEWFIMGAVVASKAVDKDVPGLVRSIKSGIDKDANQDLHFANLEHKRRIPVVNRIAESNLHSLAVLVHKPSIQDRDPWKGGRRLYLQMAMLLLEMTSTYCHEQYRTGMFGDGSAEVIFAHRQEMTEQRLRQHVEQTMNRGSTSGFQIDWSRIKPDQVYLRPYHVRVGLQLADAVCGSFRAALNIQYGCVDDGYIIKLKRMVYSSGGKQMGYGIRLWPKEAEAAVKANGHYLWLVDHYGA